MKYYKLIFENKENNSRYESKNIYKESEIENNDIDILVRSDIFSNITDIGLYFDENIEEIIKNTKIIGKTEIKIESI